MFAEKQITVLTDLLEEKNKIMRFVVYYTWLPLLLRAIIHCLTNVIDNDDYYDHSFILILFLSA